MTVEYREFSIELELPESLGKPPRLLRAGISRGLKSKTEAVERDGGDKGAGIIRGMALLSIGEAQGHGLWCDQVMLEQLVDQVNSAGEKGAKARFTHPDLSGDGLGKFTGRIKNASLDGNTARGDLHFSQSAHETPDGDLANYLMALAEDDPEAFGNSIAFEADRQAEAEFLLKHGAKINDGYLDAKSFRSPDKLNAKNLPHARIKSLMAVDAVDEPAANPNGLFRRREEIVNDAEKLLSFSLGLSRERPTLVAMNCDPDRAAGFVQRFLTRHKLSLVNEKGQPMPLTTQEIDAGIATELAKSVSPESAAKLAAKKVDRPADKDAAGEEQGDADKDEGEDDGTKQAKGDYYADKGCKTGMAKKKSTAVDVGEVAEEEAEDAGGDDDDDGKDETKMASKKKDQATTAAPGDQGSVQDGYQETQNEVAEGSKEDAEDEAAVGAPSSKKGKGIGPMGDASHNVGYSAAIEDLKKFTAAFGPTNGPLWFSQGKTFEAAQQLHAAAQQSEIDRLKAENAELSKKAGKSRGLSAPLNAGGDSTSVNPEQKKLDAAVGGGGLGRFAAGLAEQLSKPRRN